MRKKISTLFIIIFVTVSICVLYGFFLNIITYNISEEFYTKYLYFEFHILSDYGREFNGNIYLALFWISFLSNVGIGLAVGLILGSIGFCFKTSKKMLSKVLKSFGVIIPFIILFNISGYILSIIFTGDRLSFYQYPFQILDKTSFNIVNWINLFGYIGVSVGTLVAIIFLIKNVKVDKK